MNDDASQGLEGTTDAVVDESQGSETEHSLASEYLSSIEDETHRRLMEPLVKNWDAGVTRKFQEIHGQYAPYKEIGADPEQLKRSYELMQRVQNNPTEVLQALANAVGMDLAGYQAYLQSQQQQPQQQQPEQPQTPNQYQDFPEPLVNQFSRYDEQLQQLSQAVQTLVQTSQQSQQTQANAKAQYELDQTLKALHTEHGDFDEQYVLLQMYNGVDGAQAVKNFQALIDNQVQQKLAPMQQAPVVMGAGGAPPPPDNFNPGKASGKEVTQMVASLLAQQAQQGR